MTEPEPLSRKERRKAERQVKKERNQKERERQKIFAWARRLLFYLVGILLLAGAGYWSYGKWASGSPEKFVRSMGNQHIGPGGIGLTVYNSDPPTSGPHLPSTARWGIHENPIPKELQVHNLEDRGVVVQYNCSQTEPDCKALIEQLAEIVRRYQELVILAPYPKMSHKIALTAWSRIDKFNEFDEQRIVRFIDAHIGIDHHAPK